MAKTHIDFVQCERYPTAFEGIEAEVSGSREIVHALGITKPNLPE